MVWHRQYIFKTLKFAREHIENIFMFWSLCFSCFLLIFSYFLLFWFCFALFLCKMLRRAKIFFFKLPKRLFLLLTRKGEWSTCSFYWVLAITLWTCFLPMITRRTLERKKMFSSLWNSQKLELTYWYLKLNMMIKCIKLTIYWRGNQNEKHHH